MKNKQKTQIRLLPKEDLSYTVEVRDKEGRIIKRISAPSRSYVQQWNELVNLQATQTAKTVKDFGGVNRVLTNDLTTLNADGALGHLRGIVVGKGAAAVAITDYALGSLCEEGTGVDQFEHQVVVFTPPAVVGPTCSFTQERTLINNSGAAIIIGEIGIHIQSEGAAYYWHLGIRDVLPGPVTVPSGGAITVTYTIAVTV